MAEYPYLPTVGKKDAAIVVETAWPITIAMLMPLERMRVGISSEITTHPQTPGPTAKDAMKKKMATAISQPWPASGRGVIRAFSIRNGAERALSRLASGFEKKATTLLDGMLPSRAIWMGFATGPLDATTFVAARKLPKA